MNIELTDDLEQLAKSEVESGRFSTVEDFIKAALNSYAAGREAAIRNQEIRERRSSSWEDFNKPFDLAAIAAEQGVGPVVDPDDLKFDDWPEDDSVEDFIARAKGLEKLGPK